MSCQFSPHVVIETGFILKDHALCLSFLLLDMGMSLILEIDPDCWHCGASSWHKGIIDAKKFSSLTWHLFHGLVKVSIITEWWGIVIANFVDLNIQGFDLCDRSPTVTLSSSMGLSYLPDSVVQCSAYLFREGLTFYTVLKCWVMTYLALRCTKAYIIDFSVSCMDLKQNRL